MSTGICSCATPTFGNMGRPNCVIEMRVMAFPVVLPRFKADGTRNTIDLSSGTLGADIQALISASTDAEERLYPFPRVENVQWERTETVFDTAPSTRKYRVFGVGGVYTISFETWAKDAVSEIMRQAKKFGCSEFDVFIATVDGNLWGIKDDKNDTTIRGYEVSAETFDSFIQFATDTTVQKGMFSFDLDNAECVENSYAILAEEMISTGGVKSTSLTPNVAGCQTLTAPSNATLQTLVYSGFGSAGVRDVVTGLAELDFTVYDETADAPIVPLSVLEAPDGTYLITTPPMTATNIIRVEVSATGYDVENATVEAI